MPVCRLNITVCCIALELMIDAMGQPEKKLKNRFRLNFAWGAIIVLVLAVIFFVRRGCN